MVPAQSGDVSSWFDRQLHQDPNESIQTIDRHSPASWCRSGLAAAPCRFIAGLVGVREEASFARGLSAVLWWARFGRFVGRSRSGMSRWTARGLDVARIRSRAGRTSAYWRAGP